MGLGAGSGVPGRVSRVEAERVLVLAPHYDDEVLGCGGLLAGLAAAGATVRVLFLSDGSGGVEQVADREGYSRQRQREARNALSVLGAATAGDLGFEDGRLAAHRDGLAAGIRQALAQERPDLVLAPSPEEISPDHRAACGALLDVLSTARDDHRLAADLKTAEVLLYEVNRPIAEPDVLVDVGGQIATLRRAMSCYASQLERHNYLAAALGLRAFRTLSLGPEVTAAEAYKRLELVDFTTLRDSQLLSNRGDGPIARRMDREPPLSIVVRTRDRQLRLRQALESLDLNRYGALQVVLVNDGGEPPEVSADDYSFELTRVELEENQGRSVAAQAGVDAADGEYVGFLDDDDLVAPEHLTTLAAAIQAEGVEVVYSDAAVGVYTLEETGSPAPRGWQLKERRLPYGRDFDPGILLLDNYIPFNTLLMDRRLLDSVGPFDASLPFLEDWEMLIRLAQRTTFHHLQTVTCEYRHFEGATDQVFGSHPTERGDYLDVKTRILRKHADKLTPELLARAIVDLRRDHVEAAEEARLARSEIGRLERRLERRFWPTLAAELRRWRGRR